MPNPKDLPFGMKPSYEHETVLVHELLHLHFEPVYRCYDSNADIEDRAYFPMESMIDLTAEALVNLKRRGDDAQIYLRKIEGEIGLHELAVRLGDDFQDPAHA